MKQSKRHQKHSSSKSSRKAGNQLPPKDSSVSDPKDKILRDVKRLLKRIESALSSAVDDDSKYGTHDRPPSQMTDEELAEVVVPLLVSEVSKAGGLRGFERKYGVKLAR